MLPVLRPITVGSGGRMAPLPADAATTPVRPYPVPVPDRIYKDPGVADLARAVLAAVDQFGNLYVGQLAQADARLEEAIAVIDGRGGGLDGALAQVLWVPAIGAVEQDGVVHVRAGDRCAVLPGGAVAELHGERVAAGAPACR